MKFSEVKSNTTLGFSSMNSVDIIKHEIKNIGLLDLDEKVNFINEVKRELQKHSPFKNEPVDCVVWIKSDDVEANDYNPNSVAPPEMELLRTSISQDGYTQPIVSWKRDEVYEVIDGFHRNRVGKECKEIQARIHGYLPLTVINNEREAKSDRMASTIRHNRARGKHSIDSMSSIVVELKKRNWSNSRIAKNLGMDDDEVLRLCQINGLEQSFKDREFSVGWDYEVETEEQIDLEKSWPSSIRDMGRDIGWHDKTEGYSYLIGKGSKRLGSIQKSRWDGGWFVYVYTKPLLEHREDNKEDAKSFVEKAWDME